MNKLGSLEQVASKGKPIGSRWKHISMDQCNVDIHQIKELRASSYIETPDTFTNPKLGLVNIQKTCDDECFKWCVLYHQSEKSQND